MDGSGVYSPNGKLNLSTSPLSRLETSTRPHIRHALTAGIVIEDHFISLVLTGEQKPGAGREVVQWAHVSIPEPLNANHEDFPLFLKSTLSGFLGPYRKAAIWATLESRDLKLRNLNIPDVSDAKAANAALWGLKKEIEIDLENEIFDFECIENTRINQNPKKNVVAFTGDKKQVLALKKMFADAGFPLTGITAIPFAMQNFVRTRVLPVGSEPVAMVGVNRNHTEITCLSDQSVLLARTVRSGSQSLVEDLMESMDSGATDATAILSPELERSGPDFEIIRPSIDRLLGKIIRTGDYCSHNFADNEPMAAYLIFGETDHCPAFMEYAAEQLTSRVRSFSPFENQASPLNIRMPSDPVERAGVLPAMGLALSHNAHTPNLLFTHSQKSLQAGFRKMNVAIAAAGLAGLMICAGLWMWFHFQKTNELRETARITTQLSQYPRMVSQQDLSRKLGEAVRKAETIRRYARDYAGLAVINEICSLTPEPISIIQLESQFIPKSVSGPKGTDSERIRTLTLKGLVSSTSGDMESILAGYAVKLDDSPLFANVRIQNKETEKQADGTVLNFTAIMEII